MNFIMPGAACIALLTVSPMAFAQTLPPASPLTPINNEIAAAKSQTEPEDLKQMKRTKWIVTSVERDGKTVPAQYGQRKGDIITFRMDDAGNNVFG